MRRFFVKNIIFVIAINVLVKPVWVFFIDRPVQIRVPKGEYGTYQALLSIAIIFQIVLDFGISSYNSRAIASNPDKLSRLFPSMITARIGLAILYSVLGIGWGYLIGYRGWEITLLAGILLMQTLNSLFAFIRSNIAALHKFKTDGLLSVTDRLLMVVICGILLLNPDTAKNFRIQWFVGTQVFCYSVACVVAFLVLRKISKASISFSFNPKRIYKIIKDSLPYATLIFLMSIYNRADAVMIERIGRDGKVQADIWASAFRLLDMANILGLMFASMLLPLFGRMLAQKEDVQPIVKLCVNMLLPFSFTVAVCGIFYSGDIMQLLYKGVRTGVTTDHAQVFSWLIASFPAWCMMYIYSTLLTANGNLKVMNGIALGGVALNLLLNFILINRMQSVGAAITSCITQTTLSAAYVVACKKILKLETRITWILRQGAYLIAVTALAYAIHNYITLPWLVQIAVYTTICVTFMFAFRFVSVGAIRQLKGG